MEETNKETQEELEWKEPVKIKDGLHTGTITKVGFVEEPYKYTNIFIKLDESDIDIELKYGCPSILSENSKLGKLMVVFGEQFEKGKKIKIREILKDKRVEFMTLMKKGKDNKEYSEIVSDSIKPI